MIYIVLVLYKTSLEASSSYQSLVQFRSRWSQYAQLLVFNNSPDHPVPTSSEYQLEQQENAQLAGAYNYALSQAQEQGCQWLLLLDQDTVLTEEYFQALEKLLADASQAQTYDVVVPLLCQDKQLLSPLAFPIQEGPFLHQYPLVEKGQWEQLPTTDCLVAFNSVSLLSVAKLQEIGGFDTRFPLDMLDYRYYFQLHQAGVRIAVLPVRLQQNLSLNDRQHLMSAQRFSLYLKACHDFCMLLEQEALGKWNLSSRVQKNLKKFLRIILLHAFVHIKRWKYIPCLFKQMFTFKACKN